MTNPNPGATEKTRRRAEECEYCGARPINFDDEADRNRANEPTRFSVEHQCDPGTWREHSACKSQPTRLWFSNRPEETARAKAICRGCPVTVECRDYALARPGLFGVWAATSQSERTMLRVESA